MAAQRKNPLGEELLIFGNPFMAVSTLAQAEKQKAAWLSQGYTDVSIRPMHGGTYAVIAAKKRNQNPKRRRRRNSPEDQVSEADQAVTLFEKFQGKDASEILELQRSADMRLDYAALGDLRAIGVGRVTRHGDDLVHHWEQENHIDLAGDGVKLASAPNGKQLYFIGGTQELDLADFEGVDPEKDLIDLGEAGFVVYDARKKHSNFEPVEWVHEFGEESGAPPRLMYDRLKQELFLVGGEYFIDLAPELSPGIEN